MSDIVPTLFGLSPEAFKQQRQDRIDDRALALAKLDPFQRASFDIQSGANMLAGAVGGMLGGQDPELQRRTQAQQIFGTIDPANLDTFLRAAEMALQGGDQQLAFGLRNEHAQRVAASQQAARGIEESDALIGQRNASAQASLAQATRERGPTGDVAKAIRVGEITRALQTPDLNPLELSGLEAELNVLSPAPKTDTKPIVVGNALINPVTGAIIYQGPEVKKYSSFAQELIDGGLSPGTAPFQNRMLEYASGKVKGAAQGTGNVIIGGITVDTNAASKAAGTIVGPGLANIENQYSLLTAFNDAVSLVGQGIYGGAYGPEQAAATKYSLGLLGNKKKLENTEVFLANIGEIVIPRLQQFGGNDSNEELKYLQKVVAGDQRLEPAAVKRILTSAEKKVRNNIARLQKQAGGELPTGPVSAPATPKATQRYNPQTRKLEPVTGN